MYRYSSFSLHALTMARMDIGRSNLRRIDITTSYLSRGAEAGCVLRAALVSECSVLVSDTD